MRNLLLGITIGIVSSFIAQGVFQNNGTGEKLTQKTKDLITSLTSSIKRDKE